MVTPPAVQERLWLMALNDPSKAPSVRGYEEPSGVTSSSSATSSVCAVVALA